MDFYDSHIQIGKDMIAIDEGGLPDDTLLRVFDEFFAGNYTQEQEQKSFSQLEPYLKTLQEHEALKKLLLKEEKDSSIKSTSDEK